MSGAKSVAFASILLAFERLPYLKIASATSNCTSLEANWRGEEATGEPNKVTDQQLVN